MVTIKQIELQKLSPIVWYSILIYKKYPQIKALLEELGGEGLSGFLLTPKESNQEVFWIYEKELKPFDSLNSTQKEEVLEKIKEKTTKIITISEELKKSNNESQKELGELLSLAIEFPDLSFVFVDNKLEPFIAGWGFRWRDGKSTSGRILQRLNQQEEQIKTSSTPNQTTTPPPQKKESKINWLLILLLVLLLLALGVIGYLLMKKEPKNSSLNQPPKHQTTPPKKRASPTPTTPVKFKPIDPGKIKQEPNLPGKPTVITNRAVVVLKDGANIDEFKSALKSISGVKIVYESDVLKTFEIEFDSKDKISKIKAIPSVLSIKLEKVFKKNFNDPLFLDPKASWHIKAIDAIGAWKITKGSPKTVIAVVDGSFDLSHPELKDKTIIMPYNASLGVHKILNPNSKLSYHGTHVASLALASIDNSNGLAGVCPECSLMPIELAVKGQKGFSSMAVVRGILYAIDNGADVVNLSLGVSYGVDFASMPLSKKRALREKIKAEVASEKIIYKRLYDYANSKGVALVYAAGNEDMFSDIDPAKDENGSVVLVSATTKDNKKAPFSNFGENIDISAPGVKIVSATPNNSYQSMSGTSMAAPIVSGVVGLMKSIYPKITIKQIKKILKESAKDVSFPEGEKIGGLIDAKKALLLTKKLTKCNNTSTQPAPPVKKGHKMVMPPQNRGMEFSYGLWKSNSPLKNLTGEKVEVYYYISPNGSYREIHEPNDRCKGLAYPRLDGRVLYIRCNKARCQNNPRVSYAPTRVECRPNEQNIVICKSEGDSSTATFELIKVR